jgi:hypothetical protein
MLMCHQKEIAKKCVAIQKRLRTTGLEERVVGVVVVDLEFVYITFFLLSHSTDCK